MPTATRPILAAFAQRIPLVLLMCPLAAFDLIWGAEAPIPAGHLPLVSNSQLASTVVYRDPSANAALDWWRAIQALPKDGDPIWLRAKEALDGYPVALSENEMSLLSHPLRLLALGARNDYCVWGVNLVQEGFGAPLPQLGLFEKVIRLGLLRSLARGRDSAAAVDDLLLCLRSSRLAGGERPFMQEFAKAAWWERLSMKSAAQLAPSLPATERRRLQDSLPSLPPPVDVTTTLLSDWELVANTLAWMRSEPLGNRVASLTSDVTNVSSDVENVPVRPEFVNDDAIDRTLFLYPVELARLAEHWRRPMADRILPLKPAFSSGEEAPTFLVGFFWAGNAGALVDAKIAVQRLQFAAVLAFLEQGEVGLATHLDPVTGKPFKLVQDGTFRRLVAELPGLKDPVELWIGLRPPKNTNPDLPENKPEEANDF